MINLIKDNMNLNIMKYGKLVVEKKEYATVRRMLLDADHKKDSTHTSSLAKLAEELKLAEIREEAEMPDDVVRLNSMVTIGIPGNKVQSYQIVMPDKSNISQNRLSVMAPMGLALFGYAEGDEVLWLFPMGINTIKVLKVEQHAARLQEL